jgi:hypothetical protein
MGGGGGGSVSRREELVVIGSYAEVQGVAASRRFVFAATYSGIAIFDRAFARWLPPLTPRDGFQNERISAIAADPVEDALWYGTAGSIVIYRPQTDQLQRTIVAGVPDIIAFERGGNGDAIVRASGQWTRIDRVGITTPINGPPPASRLIISPTLNDVYQQFPSLRGQASFLMRDALPNRALRQYSPISGTLSPDRTTEAWLGTNGDGLWKVDPTFMQGDALRFGPLEPAVGALAPAADGVWAAGLGQSSLRGGITYGSNDLQRWEWIEGTIAVPMIGIPARAMAVREQRAWVGTDRGLVRVQLSGTRDFAAWTSLDGLPSDRVFAVAARPNGAWAGTERGLAWVSDTSDARDRRTRGIGRILLENTPVRALVAIGDTLWIGTDAGLLALPGSAASTSSTTLARPLSDDPALRRPVRAMAWSDTVLLVATDNELLRVAPRGGAAPSRFNIDVRQVGLVTRVAIDDRTMFIAGTDGVLVVQRSDGLTQRLSIGRELPGAALDLVAHRDWLWIATVQGLVRVRRTGNGSLQ